MLFIGVCVSVAWEIASKADSWASTHSILFDPILYSSLFYPLILYSALLYYTILCYPILSYTLLCPRMSHRQQSTRQPTHTYQKHTDAFHKPPTTRQHSESSQRAYHLEGISPKPLLVWFARRHPVCLRWIAFCSIAFTLFARTGSQFTCNFACISRAA